MVNRKYLLSFILFTVFAIPSYSTAIPLNSEQIAAKSSAIQQLEEKVRITGEPVSVIVRFDDGGAFRPGRATDTDKLKAAQDKLLASLGGKITNVKRFESFPFLAYTVEQEGLSQMSGDQSILAIQEDKQLKPMLAESVPLVGAPQAWNGGFTGAGQLIAIIDSGVDRDHPFLTGKLFAEACFSEDDPYSGKETLCPNGKTYQLGQGAAQPCLSGCDHGTHVAGIAVGKGVNFSGVAKDADLIAVQVFHKLWDSTRCGNNPVPCFPTSDSSAIQALDFVYKAKAANNNPIAAVNMSLGGGRYFSNCDSVNQLYADAISWLKLIDVATIVASGNDGYRDSMISPACISTAVSVGSICDTTDPNQCPQGQDSVAEHSNIAPFISMVAPGAWIYSSVPGGGYENWTGTSMAAPHVAGAWALMKQRNPLATVDDVLRDLRANAWTINDTRPGGTVTNLKSLDLHFLENAPSLVDARIKLSFEEPAANSDVAGVGNLRGWAVGPEGIHHVEFYLDGVLKKQIPYGGGRRDVGNANPGYPDSANSGFSQAYNYGLLSEGVHTMKIRAVSKTGKYKETANSFTVSKFHKGFFLDPNAMDISGSSVRQDGTGILLNNIRVEGTPYDVRLEWQVPMQQFGIIDIE